MKSLKPITIDPKTMSLFAEEAGKLVFKKEAEAELVKLLEMQKFIDELVDQVKTSIAEAGSKISDNFRGVVGEKVKAVYRRFGEKYGYNRDQVKHAHPFLKQINYYKVDSAKVDQYLVEVGEMPDGIFEKERLPKISFSIKEK